MQQTNGSYTHLQPQERLVGALTLSNTLRNTRRNGRGSLSWHGGMRLRR